MSKEKARNKSKVSKSAAKRNRTSSNTLRKRWVVYFSLIGLAGFIGFYTLIGGEMVDGTGDTPLPDFKVYTTQGEYTFSEQKGKTLVYFFAFPG